LRRPAAAQWDDAIQIRRAIRHGRRTSGFTAGHFLAQGRIPDLRHDALEVGLHAGALVRRPGAGVRPELADLLHHVVNQ
jgi:hypothetical protein